MTRQIVQSIKISKIKEEEDSEEEEEAGEDVKVEKIKKRRLLSDKFGPLANDYRNRYMLRDPDIDTTFGICLLNNGETVIGDTKKGKALRK